MACHLLATKQLSKPKITFHPLHHEKQSSVKTTQCLLTNLAELYHASFRFYVTFETGRVKTMWRNSVITAAAILVLNLVIITHNLWKIHMKWVPNLINGPIYLVVWWYANGKYIAFMCKSMPHALLNQTHLATYLRQYMAHEVHRSSISRLWLVPPSNMGCWP